MKQLIILFVFLLFSVQNYAQEKRYEISQLGLLGFTGGSGQIFINEENGLNELLIKQKTYHKNNYKLNGWRVQIYLGSGRNSRAEANKIKAKFRVRYPDIEPYLVHRSPYFKVYVGDFRSRIDAEQLRKRISKDFPNCWIGASGISINKLH